MYFTANRALSLFFFQLLSALLSLSLPSLPSLSFSPLLSSPLPSPPLPSSQIVAKRWPVQASTMAHSFTGGGPGANPGGTFGDGEGQRARCMAHHEPRLHDEGNIRHAVIRQITADHACAATPSLLFGSAFRTAQEWDTGNTPSSGSRQEKDEGDHESWGRVPPSRHVSGKWMQNPLN